MTCKERDTSDPRSSFAGETLAHFNLLPLRWQKLILQALSEGRSAEWIEGFIAARMVMRADRSRINAGKTVSPETRAKMAEAQRRRAVRERTAGLRKP